MTTDRFRIYNRIWDEGINTVAKDLGIGKKQLMDICAAYDIPMPSKSYWSIMRLGRVVPKKTPLPNFIGSQVIDIPSDVLVSSDSLSQNYQNNNKKSESKLKYKEVEPIILKPDSIPVNEEELQRAKEKLREKALRQVKTHSLRLDISGDMAEWIPKMETAILAYPVNKVLRPKKAIILDSIEYYTNQFKPWNQRDSGPYYSNKADSHLSLSVSKEMLRPALAVYDSIIDIAEALGLLLSYEDNATKVHIGDFKTSISVREINKQVMVSDPGSKYKRRELNGTGKLKICIGSGYGMKEYRETEYVGIQEKLIDFFRGLMSSYLTELEWREERRKMELRRQEEAEKKRLEELERQRIAELKNEELKRIENVIFKAYKLRTFQSLQSLAVELLKRGHAEESSEIFKIAKMFDPVYPQYGDVLGADDIDKLVYKFMNYKL